MELSCIEKYLGTLSVWHHARQFWTKHRTIILHLAVALTLYDWLANLTFFLLLVPGGKFIHIAIHPFPLLSVVAQETFNIRPLLCSAVHYSCMILQGFYLCMYYLLIRHGLCQLRRQRNRLSINTESSLNIRTENSNIQRNTMRKPWWISFMRGSFWAIVINYCCSWGFDLLECIPIAGKAVIYGLHPILVLGNLLISKLLDYHPDASLSVLFIGNVLYFVEGMYLYALYLLARWGIARLAN